MLLISDKLAYLQLNYKFIDVHFKDFSISGCHQTTAFRLYTIQRVLTMVNGYGYGV